MKVLSLFDGISCAKVALKRARLPVTMYYSSEIDKYAITISEKNHPDIRQIGNVKNVLDNFRYARYGHIDLLIGGSPCQDLSIAGKRKGLDGERSGLFWDYAEILKKLKPKWFVLENVASMSKEARDIITKELGVEPIMINASLVSAQNRKRLFWTNIPNVTQPKDRGIILKDILENADADRLKSYCIDSSYYKGGNWEHYKKLGRRQMVIVKPVALRNRGEGKKPEFNKTNKANAMTSVQTDSMVGFIIPEATKKGYTVAKEGQSVDLSFPTSKTRRGRVGDKVKNLMTSQNIGVVQNMQIRKLTPVECERLQGLPDDYTEGVSNTQRYKALGNAFNVDVVAHILSFIKKA